MRLGRHSEANTITKAVVFKQLEAIDQWLAAQNDIDFSAYYRMESHNFFEIPGDYSPPVSNRLPDGSPIGSLSCDY